MAKRKPIQVIAGNGLQQGKLLFDSAMVYLSPANSGAWTAQTIPRVLTAPAEWTKLSSGITSHVGEMLPICLRGLIRSLYRQNIPAGWLI